MLSSGMAMMFFLHYDIALAMDAYGVKARDFPYEINPLPLPINRSVLKKLMRLSVVTLVDVFFSMSIIMKSSLI